MVEGQATVVASAGNRSPRHWTILAQLHQHSVTLLAAVAFALGVWQFGGGAYVYAKAAVGEWLIARAFESGRETGFATRAWPWADTRPIARLAWQDGEVTRHVLDSASGEALAWGAGRIAGPQSTALAAHRDTHFAFLKDVTVGHTFELTPLRGVARRYRVQQTAVLHTSDVDSLSRFGDDALVLVTCYPFTGAGRFTQTPWRYLVVAVPASSRFQ